MAVILESSLISNLVLLSAECDFAPAYKISLKSYHPRQNYDVIPISRLISGFGFVAVNRLRMLKSICSPNLSKISQSKVEILLLPVSENKRPPYWYSSSNFDFSLINCQRHIILHWPNEFHSVQTTHGKCVGPELTGPRH